MKSLYTRIVITFIFISITSSIAALIASNIFYQAQLKGGSERKILEIGKEIRLLYEQIPELDFDAYLSHIANMGFQIYVVNDQLEETDYGGAFRQKSMEREQIQRVLNGEIYAGEVKKRHLFTISFFENSIHNSVGIPVKVNERSFAVFVRPNLEQQIGEVRIFMAILLLLTFISSTVLIVILSRNIVKPVRKLTLATNQIVGGNYDVQLNVSRLDEIGNLARHFTVMAQSLKQLEAMRQEFVANVSHEIQSPLTSIQGFTQTIIDKEATSEEIEQYLRIIVDESRRLSSVSKQLLIMATLDKEATIIRKSDFRLDEQIRQILIVTEWQWTEKQLIIDPELAEFIVFADSELMYQVWFNLISNSIKFSNPDGVIRIEIALEQQLVIMISDTGIGIDEADLPYIFERFYKGDKSRNSLRSGSGLGLSIVKKIVQLHQGSIEVHSKLGEGTTFTVRLPYQ